MTPEIWIVLLILNKFLVYLGIAAAIGGSANLLLFTHRDGSATHCNAIRQWQTRSCRFALFFIVVGFTANVADFFVQTGNLSETGIKGMFEPFMLNLMWTSSIGTLTIVRAVSLGLSGAMILYVLFIPYSFKSPPKLVAFGLVALIVVMALSYSFTLSGHTTNIEFGGAVLISLHVAMLFAWLGSLIPLIYATYFFDDKELYLLMDRFGSYASWGVAIVLVAGATMLIQLVPSIDDLLSSSYGQLFMLKIGLVLVLLLFALAHKFLLVPHLLQQDNGHIKLRHSIMGEASIGLLVLLTTSVVTTAVGPVN